MKPRSILFLLWTFQGLGGLLWLAALPTTTEHGLVLGFSASRLGLMGLMFFVTSVSAWLYFSKIDLFLAIPAGNRQPVYILAVLTALAAPALIILLYALGNNASSYQYVAYAGRLAPVAAWLALSALELAASIARAKGSPVNTQTGWRIFFRQTSLALIFLGFIAAFIAITRLGITRYNDGSWGEPTTPLLEWQILLAVFASLVYVSLRGRWKWLERDWIVALVIYAFTCLLWLSQPVRPGFFATAPRAPNFEIYPFSDALIYAQYAQSALVGNGFMWPDVPTRPLYIAFLTWLHALAGQDYTHIIALQTLVLAAFPAVLYLLGKEISGQGLGLGLAILAAFRDLTANLAAPFALNYTYSKLYFSELPAALLLSLFSWISIRWMRRSQPPWYALMAGGVLGLAALTRLQSVVALAAVIPLGFFVIKQRRYWLAGSALMVLGVALALTPWLLRNYRATGGFVLDNPISQSMVLARRWGGDSGNTLIPHLPGEGDAQYSRRMTTMALASLRADPGRILGSAANHFFNNEISNLLVFPLRDQLESPRELFQPSRAFWQSWDGQPTPAQMGVIALYALFFATGLVAAMNRAGLAGVLPLALSLVYNAWTALFLSSGDRFLVPVDWAVYLYIFLGVLSLASLAFQGRLFTEEVLVKENKPDGAQQFFWRRLSLTGALILMAGASLPLTELAFPHRYPAIQPLPAGGQPVVTLTGRAIYPRWYDAGDGEAGSAKMGYGTSDQARLVFFMAGEENTLVIFPLKSSPLFFPNASDVTVHGSLQDGYLLADQASASKDGRTADYSQK